MCAALPSIPGQAVEFRFCLMILMAGTGTVGGVRTTRGGCFEVVKTGVDEDGERRPSSQRAIERFDAPPVTCEVSRDGPIVAARSAIHKMPVL
jgi:hypothetical protein